MMAISYLSALSLATVTGISDTISLILLTSVMGVKSPEQSCPGPGLFSFRPGLDPDQEIFGSRKTLALSIRYFRLNFLVNNTLDELANKSVIAIIKY